MRINKETCKARLGDVQPQFSFWVKDGPLLRNIYELRDELKNIRDDTYTYHANKEKNDFSNWVRDIIGEEKLAKSLEKARDKLDAAKKVGAWIDKTEKILFK